MRFATLGDKSVPLIGNKDYGLTRLAQSGQIVGGYSDFWGGAEFMYVRATAAIRQFGIVKLTRTFQAPQDPTIPSGGPTLASVWEATVTEAASTAILGNSVGIAMRDMATNEYGWVMITGCCPVNMNASVAADTTFSVAATGQGGAAVAGKQVLNARVMAAGSTTVVKKGYGKNGALQLRVADGMGWFPGIYLSGTGIQATTTVTDMSDDGTIATLSLALSAAIQGGNVTGTYNNATIFYNVAAFDRPFQQGAIT